VIDHTILDPTTRTFWEGARVGEIRLQHCADCGLYQFYPRPFCLRCQGSNLGWRAVSGRGTVHSVVTVHLAVIEELVPPYRVALVELDEGPRFLGLVAEQIAIGDVVRGRWQSSEPGAARLIFDAVS
jgi:hypothetical protein